MFRATFSASPQLRLPDRLPLAVPAAAPAAAEFQAFASDASVEGKVLEAGRQLAAADVAVAQRHPSVDPRRQQAAGQPAAAVQPALQFLHHRHERARQRQVEAGQAELAAQRLARQARVDLRLHPQLAELRSAEVEGGIDAVGRQPALQAQAVVADVDPLALVAQAQRTAAGVQADHAARAAGRNVQLQVAVQLALPGEVLGEPLLQAVQREVAQGVAQPRLGQQALLAAAEAGGAGYPAMCAEIDPAVGQPLQARRLL